MAKSLLEILSPLESMENHHGLYQELKLLCPTEENKLDPQIQANIIRNRLAEELWKRGDKPNEYSEEKLAILYEAGQQITHEYPVNRDSVTGKFECPISLDDIELGDNPQARANETYVFSVVSGIVYQRESLVLRLGDIQTDPLDPVTTMSYSPYELEKLEIRPHTAFIDRRRNRNNAVPQQESVFFILGIHENELDKRISIACVAAILGNTFFAIGMFGYSEDLMLKTLICTPVQLFVCIGFPSMIANTYGQLARESPDPIHRVEHLMGARTWVLAGSASVLLPYTLAMYAVLGKMTGKMLAGWLGAEDSAVQAGQAGMILAPMFAMAVIIPLIKSYWDLRHLRAIDPPRNAQEQTTRHRITSDAFLIAFSVLLSGLGYLMGLPLKLLPDVSGAEDSSKIGVRVGFLLGVMLTCLCKGGDIIQSCHRSLGWCRRRGVENDHDQLVSVQIRGSQLNTHV